MSQTYGAVDASKDPSAAAAWQERMSTWPAVRAYKDRSYRLLDEATLVLDVGCGPGIDLVRLGVGRAIGVDLSITMCRRARQSEAPVCQAAAEALGHLGGERAKQSLIRAARDPDGDVAAAIQIALQAIIAENTN